MKTFKETKWISQGNLHLRYENKPPKLKEVKGLRTNTRVTWTYSKTFKA